MEVYYCSKCEGRPYTKKLSGGIVCPVCKSVLKCEDVTEESLVSRKTLEMKRQGINFSDILKKDISGLSSKDISTAYQSRFRINDGEIFYIYLGFIKTGKINFKCRFILGNTPDEFNIINKTPFVSPEMPFEHTIELETLEKMRKSFEKPILAGSWREDHRLFHAYSKVNDETVFKVITPVSEKKLSDDIKYSERYFIEYNYQGYSDIRLKAPFRSSEPGFFDELKRVYDSQNSKFMDYMLFRAKNGDTMTIKSFADDSSLIYDEPHMSIIRYDRLMKEAQSTRM